jgi:hypothetical protein
MMQNQPARLRCAVSEFRSKLLNSGVVDSIARRRAAMATQSKNDKLKTSWT